MTPEPPSSSEIDPLLTLSAAELAAAVNSGRVSALEVVEATLARIEARRAGNAFITVCAEEARARARRMDMARARRHPQGAPTDAPPAAPLAGVPLAVKDLFDTAGVRTTAGSAILADRIPARTATAVARLEAAGAIVVGKTNMHEFAWGVTSQNPHYGTVANPTLPGRVAGGSSGGSAAALADHQATIALGTDTGGSIRIPSACCGTVGFKPASRAAVVAFGAAGAMPIRGVFPLAPSFDTVGPMARTVADVALLDSVLTGRPIPAPAAANLRVGVLAPAATMGTARGIEATLTALGARLEPAELPELDPDLMAAFGYECAATHRPWYPSRRDEYGADLQQKLEAAQSITADQWQRGLAAARRLRRLARRALPFDLLVSPVLAMEPPPADCWELDVRAEMTRWTRPFNFLGWPAIAIGGIQLAGRSREIVLGVALASERAGSLRK
jgi:aspartyl-tRNA(Asn)/glutamyl-tRNA(Gln) amidotransferase subunit A